MLWQKDLKTGNYVDLSKNVIHSTDNIRFNSKKSQTLSILARTAGNKKYSQRNFEGAMNLYNESICYAENESEYLSLAFANRSSCFFELGMYDRSLVDIQLAQEANYPKHLMSKLVDRKLKCIEKLESIKQHTHTPNEPALNFEADDKLPCMANVLKITNDKQYGRLVTTARDIQIGETILIEEAYIHKVFGAKFCKCTNCSKEKMNFIPCNGCNDAMFCSKKCAENMYHSVECDMVFESYDNLNGESLSFLFRSVVIGINSFDSIAEMMEFVEDCLTSPNEISKSITSDKAKYRTFFQISKYVSDQRISDIHNISYIIVKAILSSKLEINFERADTQQFLMHLVVHHGLILQTNAFGGFADPETPISQSTAADCFNKERGKKLHLISSYFNHSCAPNIVKLEKNNLAVCKAILPIRKGDQIFLTYINVDEFITKAEKSKHLLNQYGFICQCQICTKGYLKVASICDPNYDFVLTNLKTLLNSFDMVLVKKIKECCIAFLLENPHLVASFEGNLIARNLSAMFQKEINNASSNWRGVSVAMHLNIEVRPSPYRQCIPVRHGIRIWVDENNNQSFNDVNRGNNENRSESENVPNNEASFLDVD